MRIPINNDVDRVVTDYASNSAFFLLRGNQYSKLKFEEWMEDMETSEPF